jgi:predicted RNase H-like HicB family nuclease
MGAPRRTALGARRRIARVDEVAIRLHIEPLKEGGYVATSPDVPGLVAEGRSITEAVEIAQGLTRKIVESCLDHGDPVPPALTRLAEGPLELTVPVGIR